MCLQKAKNGNFEGRKLEVVIFSHPEALEGFLEIGKASKILRMLRRSLEVSKSISPYFQWSRTVGCSLICPLILFEVFKCALTLRYYLGGLVSVRILGTESPLVYLYVFIIRFISKTRVVEILH